MSVYLFECFAFFEGCHSVKIGFSSCEFTNDEISNRKKIQKRLRSLQTGISIPIFLRALKCGDQKEEKRLHEKYRPSCQISKYWVQKCDDLYHGTEWFLLSENEYKRLLKDFTKRYEIPKTFERPKFYSLSEGKNLKQAEEKICSLQNELFDKDEEIQLLLEQIKILDLENSKLRKRISNRRKKIQKELIKIS